MYLITSFHQQKADDILFDKARVCQKQVGTPFAHKTVEERKVQRQTARKIILLISTSRRKLCLTTTTSRQVKRPRTLTSVQRNGAKKTHAKMMFKKRETQSQCSQDKAPLHTRFYGRVFGC
jgi:hypothetical protein